MLMDSVPVPLLEFERLFGGEEREWDPAVSVVRVHEKCFVKNTTFRYFRLRCVGRVYEECFVERQRSDIFVQTVGTFAYRRFKSCLRSQLRYTLSEWFFAVQMTHASRHCKIPAQLGCFSKFVKSSQNSPFFTASNNCSMHVSQCTYYGGPPVGVTPGGTFINRRSALMHVSDGCIVAKLNLERQLKT